MERFHYPNVPDSEHDWLVREWELQILKVSIPFRFFNEFFPIKRNSGNQFLEKNVLDG